MSLQIKVKKQSKTGSSQRDMN